MERNDFTDYLVGVERKLTLKAEELEELRGIVKGLIHCTTHKVPLDVKDITMRVIERVQALN